MKKNHDTASSGTETIGDYTWIYETDDDSATLTKVSPKPSGALTIPSELGGKPVTSIGEDAFNGCESLTTITIPDSVTSIGENAFYGCKSLKNVIVENPSLDLSNARIRRSAKVTFGKAVKNGSEATVPTKSTNGQATTSDYNWKYTIIDGGAKIFGVSPKPSGPLTIPSELGGKPVKSIDKEAFEKCESLTSITIPNGVKRIGERAFIGCSSLTSITIPNGVKRIDKEAFEKCESLTSITIPDSVTRIGKCAFAECRSLKSITFPKNVTSIGKGAFFACESLKSVIIENPWLALNDFLFPRSAKVTYVGK